MTYSKSLYQLRNPVYRFIHEGKKRLILWIFLRFIDWFCRKWNWIDFVGFYNILLCFKIEVRCWKNSSMKSIKKITYKNYYVSLDSRQNPFKTVHVCWDLFYHFVLFLYLLSITQTSNLNSMFGSIMIIHFIFLFIYIFVI